MINLTLADILKRDYLLIYLYEVTVELLQWCILLYKYLIVQKNLLGMLLNCSPKMNQLVVFLTPCKTWTGFMRAWKGSFRYTSQCSCIHLFVSWFLGWFSLLKCQVQYVSVTNCFTVPYNKCPSNNFVLFIYNCDHNGDMVFWKFSAVSWSYTMDTGENFMLLDRKATKNVMNPWRIHDKKANPAYICYLASKHWSSDRMFCWL